MNPQEQSLRAPVLVTGALGNVGREVVRALLASGQTPRMAVRRPQSVEHDLPEGAELAAFDYLDPTTWSEAVRGCRGVFLLRPPPISNTRETLVPFIDAARAQNASQIVFLSVQGAGENSIVPHHAVEQHLFKIGGDFTILRPGFFAQNLSDAYRRDIQEDDRIYVPAGKGRAAFIDVKDLAEVAALIFQMPDAHRGQAYTLTGPAAVSFSEVATVLSDALGRPIRYVPASVVGYIHHLRKRKLPWAQALVQSVLHVGLRFGQAEKVDPTLEKLLGHPSTPIESMVSAHLDLWR